MYIQQVSIELKHLIITATAVVSDDTGERKLTMEAEGKALRMELEVRNDR